MEIVFGKIPFEKMLGRLSVLDWEAVLLGVSGFLQGSTDDLYIIQLRERFRILKMRFSLEEIPVSLWRFSRMRPANFPPVRLIQLAQLFAFLPNSLQQVGSRQIEQAFVWLNELDIHSSAFWIDARVINGYTIKSSHKLLSKQMKAVIFANAFVPYILAMANEEEVPMLLVSVLNTLHKLPAESNSITQKWNLLFPNIDTMAFSQMIIAQYKMKCMEKACMSCLVGISVCRD
jgi:hypothetical protein